MCGNVTDQRRAQQEIERLNRLYATLVELHQTVTSVKSRAELFDEVCRITAEKAGFKLVWIGWHAPHSHEIIPVARAGDGEYLDTVRIYADDRPEGHGPVGTCIRQRRPDIVNDFLNDPRAAAWHEPAAEHGLLAAAALPIYFQGQVVAAFAVYTAEPGVFQDQEVALLEEAAAAISFALESLARGGPPTCGSGPAQERRELPRHCQLHGGLGKLAGLDRELLWVSPSVERITGYSAAECYAMRRYPLPLIAEEDRERIAEMFGRPRGDGQGEDLEFRIVRKDAQFGGFPPPGNRSTTPTASFWASGRHRDTTERKRAEEALERSREEAEILNRIGRVFLSVPNDNMYAGVLQIVLAVMKSPHGIFAYIDEDGANVVPSMTGEVWQGDQMPDKTVRFPSETWGDGVWSKALRQKRSICSNQPGRVPPGHVPVRRAWRSRLSTRTKPSAISRWPTKKTTIRPTTCRGWNGLRLILLPPCKSASGAPRTNGTGSRRMRRCGRPSPTIAA